MITHRPRIRFPRRSSVHRAACALLVLLAAPGAKADPASPPTLLLGPRRSSPALISPTIAGLLEGHDQSSDGLAEHMRLELPKKSAIRELKIVSTRHEERCRYHLVARDDSGWFGVKTEICEREGTCDTAPRRGAPGRVPTRLELRAGAAVLDVDEIDRDGNTTPKLDYVRCRVDTYALACDYGGERRRLDDDLRWSVEPGPPVDAIGRTTEANFWIASPRELEHASSGWLQRQPWLGRELAVTGSSMLLGFIVHGADGNVRRANLWHESRIFSQSKAEVTTSHGVVRVDLTTVEKGKQLTLTRRWCHLLVPPAPGRDALHLRLVTAVIVHDHRATADHVAVVGWERMIEVHPDGLLSTELDGPLAWFRLTGTLTWEELMKRLPRLAERTKESFDAERAILREERGSPIPRWRVDRPLDLLPGSVEPLDDQLIDQVQVFAMP